MGRFYLTGNINDKKLAEAAAPTATAVSMVELPPFVVPNPGDSTVGLSRITDLHTLLPEKPRYDITQYTVVEGDTIFGIAEKFNLQPQTILWGNLYTLGDQPHNLQPGQVLNILPLDGVLHRWTSGEGLNGVSEYYGVSPDDIINWPGNNLSLETIGEFSQPNIENNTDIFVPGGSRGFVTWSAPRISRSDPAVAKILGPGYCGVVVDGAVGNGTYVWPTTARYISGYDYSPATNHFAIDIGGTAGNAIYASDNGVIVYSGWNNYGYGNMVVIDHGGGWQTLYAHLLGDLLPACGSSVYQGDMVAHMGSTGNSSGPHLHFEMLSETYGKVDPKLFLQ
jgi:murein DD-endopeptidase MepM/ murein hydrolase activator NlpD